MIPTEDRKIKYLNKTFSEFKASLQELAKTYFPNTYNDFSEASPGMMFMEMASYVGDVSSFYIDTQIQENFLNLAKEKESLYNLAYSFGYRPKLSYASTTEVEISQLIPLTSGTPDFSYSLVIPAYTSITSNQDFQTFLTTKDLDFSDTSSVKTSYFNENFYILTKSVPVISAEIVTTTATFQPNSKFASYTIEDPNFLQIIAVTGSGGASDKWYEVPYLAQDTIFESISNSNSGSDNINYLLALKKVPQRFVTRVKGTGSIELQFGAGVSAQNDTSILPTPDNINLGLVSSVSTLSNELNKASVYFTKGYGVAPSGDLNIKYLTGGGIASNISANTLTNIDTTGVSLWFKYNGVQDANRNVIMSSITVNNPNPATGGRGADSVEEIRLNTLNSYTAQNRAVTKEDYILRALSLPSHYGNIAKAYVTQEIFNSTDSLSSSNNPLSLDLYILAYNSNKQLIEANSTLKSNLKSYLNEYRMITDAINIKNAFYINFGIDFEVGVDPSYYNQEVLSNCIIALQNYFNIDKWQINQPIKKSEVIATLIQIPGVQAVYKMEFINKQGGNYAPYAYDMLAATKNNIIYPSIDPSIFEIRFPNADISGRVVNP